MSSNFHLKLEGFTPNNMTLTITNTLNEDAKVGLYAVQAFRSARSGGWECHDAKDQKIPYRGPKIKRRALEQDNPDDWVVIAANSSYVLTNCDITDKYHGLGTGCKVKAQWSLMESNTITLSGAAPAPAPYPSPFIKR